MTESKDHCSCWWDGDWDRLEADAALAAGISQRGRWYGHGLMALLMFGGVRIFANRQVSWFTRRMWGRQHRFNWYKKSKKEA